MPELSFLLDPNVRCPCCSYALMCVMMTLSVLSVLLIAVLYFSHVQYNMTARAWRPQIISAKHPDNR
ncbi:hypothetical protein N9L68_08170 [bacterium]|nr:hypothetical protein [bacterium]